MIRSRIVATRIAVVVVLTASGLLGPIGERGAISAPAARLTVQAGREFSCALLPGGTVRCWGYRGSLGDGADLNVLPRPLMPVTVKDLSGAIAISSGSASCARFPSRKVKCWGERRRRTPTTLREEPGFANAVAISYGFSHVCAVRVNGTIRCRGGNHKGQLGHGDTNHHATPVGVRGVTKAISISAGGLHSCALLSDRTAQCWGRNANGELGTGKVFDKSVTAVTVRGLSGAIAISAGFYHSCALLPSRTVKCWGHNANGALGNGTRVDSSRPVAVPGLADVVAISAGYEYTCAVVKSGIAKCWGLNARGILGNGSFRDSSVPIAVRGVTTAVGISAGNSHACVALADDTARCWGSNTRGELGNRKREASSVPVEVVYLTGD